MTHRFIIPIIISVIAAPALADITADDVWENNKAMAIAMGATLDATYLREGNTVFVNDAIMTYPLPLNYGEMRVSVPPMTMIEEPDGTVRIILPKTMDYQMVVNLHAPISIGFDATMRIQTSESKNLASGVPGAITYSQSVGQFTSSIDIHMRSDFEFEPFSFSMKEAGDGYDMQTTIAQGDLIQVATKITMQPVKFEIDSVDGFLSRTIEEGSSGLTETTFAMAIPATGFDILNLAPALRDGMFLRAEHESEFMHDRQTNYIDDTEISGLVFTTGPSVSGLEISQDGVSGHASVVDFWADYTATTPSGLAATIDIAQLAMSGHFPLLASQTPQEMRYQSNFSGLTLSDETWAQFDPVGILSRAPANMDLDVSAQVTPNIEILDFMNLESAILTTKVPVTPRDVTINNFSLDGIGITATGTGAFELDMIDLETFDGFPRPEGAADIGMTGIHTLLDNLITLDVLQSDEAAMARLMIGMFTRDAGNGTLSTAVEINEAGEILMNGERVR